VEAKSAKHWFHEFVVPHNHAQGTIKIVQCTPVVRLKIHRMRRGGVPQMRATCAYLIDLRFDDSKN
jgi:hypothetical protein